MKMSIKKIFKKGKDKLLLLTVMALMSLQSFATNEGMVWEKPTSMVQESITGPMAKYISLAVVVVTAFGWAFSEGGNFLGKGIKIIVALAIAAGSTLVVTALYGNYASSVVFI